MGKSPALQAQRLFENLLHGPSSALQCLACLTHERTSRTELRWLSATFELILRTWGLSVNPRFMASQHDNAIGRLEFKTVEPPSQPKKRGDLLIRAFLMIDPE